LAIIHPAPRFAVEEMSVLSDDIGPVVCHDFTSRVEELSGSSAIR
jgi:hypothetical protein